MKANTNELDNFERLHGWGEFTMPPERSVDDIPGPPRISPSPRYVLRALLRDGDDQLLELPLAHCVLATLTVTLCHVRQ